MSISVKLKSPAALAPNKKVSLSFEALKPGIEFSSLPMKVLDSIFFQEKAVFIYTENLLFNAATFINYPS